MFFIVCIGSLAAVVLRHGGDLSVSGVGVASHSAVLSGLGQQISVAVIGIGGGYALSVRHGGQIPLLIVSAAFRCAVGISDLGGTELIVVGIDSGISVGIHGGGAALAIGEGYNCALCVGLLCDTSFCVIDISHHAVAVLVLPRRHPVLCVIGIAAPVSRRVCHSGQVSRPIIGIADMVAVRQTDLCDPVFFIQRHEIVLSGGRCDSAQAVVHVVGQSGSVAIDIFQPCQHPVGVEQMLLKAAQICQDKAVSLLCQCVVITVGSRIALRRFLKGHNAAGAGKP